MRKIYCSGLLIKVDPRFSLHACHPSFYLFQKNFSVRAKKAYTNRLCLSEAYFRFRQSFLLCYSAQRLAFSSTYGLPSQDVSRMMTLRCLRLSRSWQSPYNYQTTFFEHRAFWRTFRLGDDARSKVITNETAQQLKQFEEEKKERAGNALLLCWPREMRLLRTTWLRVFSFIVGDVARLRQCLGFPGTREDRN